jgi:hypothetical protein
LNVSTNKQLASTSERIFTGKISVTEHFDLFRSLYRAHLSHQMGGNGYDEIGFGQKVKIGDEAQIGDDKVIDKLFDTQLHHDDPDVIAKHKAQQLKDHDQFQSELEQVTLNQLDQHPVYQRNLISGMALFVANIPTFHPLLANLHPVAIQTLFHYYVVILCTAHKRLDLTPLFLEVFKLPDESPIKIGFFLLLSHHITLPFLIFSQIGVSVRGQSGDYCLLVETFKHYHKYNPTVYYDLFELFRTLESPESVFWYDDPIDIFHRLCELIQLLELAQLPLPNDIAFRYKTQS